MPNEYYLGRDENGKVKLMHWKYVKRERKGDGWKYYYSWDEVKNAAGNAVDNAVNATKKAIGIGTKEAYEKAQRNTEWAQRYVDASKKVRLADQQKRAENAKSAKATYDAEQQRADTVNKVFGKLIGNVTGANEKANTAKADFDKIKTDDRTNKKTLAKDYENLASAKKAEAEAKAAHEKSLAGRVEKAKADLDMGIAKAKDAWDDTVDSIKDTADKAGAKTKELANTAVREIEKTYDKAIDKASSWLDSIFPTVTTKTSYTTVWVDGKPVTRKRVTKTEK